MLLWHEILLNSNKNLNISSGKMDLAVTGWQKPLNIIPRYRAIARFTGE